MKTHPSMTKQHFEVIAALIKETRRPADNTSAFNADKMAYLFALALADTNAHFDRDRFLRACGVE